MILNLGRFLGIFYADDSMIRAQDSECLQNVLDVTICLFRQYGIVANVVKS